MGVENKDVGRMLGESFGWDNVDGSNCIVGVLCA